MRPLRAASPLVCALVLACSSSSGSGSSPGDDGGGGSTTTPAEESVWLDPMNMARAAVGDKALTWDPIAASVAATYAAMCNFDHNANRNAQYQALGGSSSGVGENISGGAPTQDPGSAVTSWLSEESTYDHGTNTCASGATCGHYTQIVWSTTTGVGCAHVSCTTSSPFGSQFPTWDFSVCDFSPPGNIGTEAPY
jgi:pathogenesis-related protein 1